VAKVKEHRMVTKKIVTAGIVLMLSASGATAQMRPGTRAVLQACKPDIARFCSQVPPGQGRIKACMKEHLQELSEPCKEGLFQAWLHQ
jgi:cysteine rich repeat protein